MKRCPQCNRVETDDALVYCRADGTPLVAQLNSTEEAVTQTFESPNKPETTQKQFATRGLPASRSLRTGVLIGGALLLVLATSAYFYITREKSGPTTNSIAVLPFVNASGDPAMEYLSDGISESLINSLSQLPNMRVMARSTSFSFKGKDSDPSAIGKQLGVSSVLTGKLVQVGDSLSVQVDLVNASDGSQLWGEHYNRKPTDLLAVQEEIAREVVQKLRLRLSTEERDRLTKRYTENIDAYRTYLKGRYEWNKRTAAGLQRAIELFNEAIGLDASYALAYAGMADTYLLLPQYADAPFEESMTRAKAAAWRAIKLDDSLAEAHVSLANVKQSQWEWNEVESDYKRGLALNPNYATGHQWYSEYLVPVGRLEEAQKEITRAQELDPMSLMINVRVGMTSYFSRHFALAEKQLKDALQFDPDFILTNIFLFNSMYQQGKIQESIPHVVNGCFNGYSQQERSKFESDIRAAYLARGTKGMLEKTRDLLQASTKGEYSRPHLLAVLFACLGNRDEAFVWLKRSADVKHPGVPTLRVDAMFDDLHSDPRFAEMMKRVGI